MENILKTVAECSPAHYAETIRCRNQELLKQLNNALDHDLTGVFDVPLRCPHCTYSKDYGFMCGDCLWSIRNPKISMQCIYVKFNGISLATFCDHLYIRVTYTHSFASIKVCKRPDNKDDQICFDKEVEVTKRFLQGHIDWTNKYEWGCEA